MASPAKSSAPPLSEARRSEPDNTDPQATAAADDLVVTPGLDDKTQILDTRPSAGPEYKILVLAGPKAGSEFPIEHEEFTVGRAVENIVSIPDVSVSRKHVKFVRTGDGFLVTDLKSGNGTKLNGAPTQAATVRHGDQVTLGDTVLQLIDLSQPLPERLKPINTLQSPSGQSGPPQMTTEVEGARLPPISRKTPAVEAPKPAPPLAPAPKPVEKAPPEPVAKPAPKAAPARKAKKPAAPNRLRKNLLAAVLVLIVFFMAAYLLKHHGPVGGSPMEGPAADTGLPKAILDARDLVVKSHDWVAAERLLLPLQDSTDPAVVRWLKAVPIEAKYQRTLASGQAALDGFQLDEGRRLLESIPEDADVYPQAQEALRTIDQRLQVTLDEAKQALAADDPEKALTLVEKVLLAEPNNAAAQAVKDDAERAMKRQHKRIPRAGPHPRPLPTPVPTPVAAPAPKLPFAGPWLTAYLNNQLNDALRLADASSDPQIKGTFAGLVRQFSANYTQGMELAEAKHTLEAVRYLAQAIRIDQRIMAQRASQYRDDLPGREVRKQFSNIEYLLSLDTRSDDQLYMRARHLGLALTADPTNQLAKKALADCYTRAEGMFDQAYQMKDTDAAAALRMFKIVYQTLPRSAVHSAKSAYWIKALEKHPMDPEE